MSDKETKPQNVDRYTAHAIIRPAQYVLVCPSCQFENVMDQQYRWIECGHCGVECEVEYDQKQDLRNGKVTCV